MEWAPLFVVSAPGMAPSPPWRPGGAPVEPWDWAAPWNQEAPFKVIALLASLPPP